MAQHSRCQSRKGREPMGWFRDDRPGHEGYVLGLRDDGEGDWHALTRDDEYPERRLKMVQVACECGWRSQRLHAPHRAEWYPCIVEFHDEGAEELARRLWHEHMDCPSTKADHAGAFYLIGAKVSLVCDRGCPGVRWVPSNSVDVTTTGHTDLLCTCGAPLIAMLWPDSERQRQLLAGKAKKG